MALTADVPILRVGSRNKDPVAAPLPTGVTVYTGSISLLDSNGLLKNSSSPASTDTCIGINGNPTGGTYVKTGPGIVGAGTTEAAYVYVDVECGTFLLASGTGADALTEATAGATVYAINETTVGKTNGSTTRPAAGVQLPREPSMPTGLWPIKMNSFGGTGP
jgi:hypothetical protein